MWLLYLNHTSMGPQGLVHFSKMCSIAKKQNVSNQGSKVSLVNNWWKRNFHIIPKQSQESNASSVSLITHLSKMCMSYMIAEIVLAGPQRKGPDGWACGQNCKAQTALHLFISCSVLCWLDGRGVLLPHPDRKVLIVPCQGWELAPCRDCWPLPLLSGSLHTRQREEAVFPENLIDGMLCCQVPWRQ